MNAGNYQPTSNTSTSANDNKIMSMAELLAQEETTFPNIKHGEIIKGVVARKTSNEILVDVGAKSEGIVDSKDLNKLAPEELAQIRTGDTVYVYVLRASDDEDDDRVILSLSQARAEQDWDEAEKLYRSGDTIERVVIGHNKGGLIVDFGQLRGFVPGSQLVTGQATGPTRLDKWQQMAGKMLKLRIIEVDRTRNRLILSERVVAEKQREQQQEKRIEYLQAIEEGSTLSGRVTRITDFGAFVDIGKGVDGLVHLSELAWARILHPSEILKVGDEIEVYVLRVDPAQQRVALSRKRLQKEPWEDVFQHYQINQVVDAVVTKIADFGAFARIDTKIEGLIHISEISDNNITHPSQVLEEKQEIKVRIINIDPERRRMGLSMKQVEDAENWQEHQAESGEPPNDDDES